MPDLKHLKIDDKWGVFYDPNHNDRPVTWTRYNEVREAFIENDAIVAMFYALLAKSNPCKCIDCGGDQPTHSSNCTEMASLHGDEKEYAKTVMRKLNLFGDS